MDAPNRNDHARVLSLTAVLIALAVAALLIPIPLRGRIASATGDLVHAPLFAALTIGALWLTQYLRPLQPPGATFLVRSAVVTAIVFAAGLASEVAQTYFRRNGSVHDAIANGLGILAAWLCYLAWHHQQKWPQRRLTRLAMMAAAVVSIGAASLSPLIVLRDIVVARRQFPLIASFECRTALQRWHFRQCQGRITDQDVTHGLRAMEVTFNPTSYPGLSLLELYADWREMTTLQMDVTLDESYPRDSVEFSVKIFDRWHGQDGADAVELRRTLKRGEKRHITIPRREIVNAGGGRLFDLSSIRIIELTILEPGSHATLRMDSIELTL